MCLRHAGVDSQCYRIMIRVHFKRSFCFIPTSEFFFYALTFVMWPDYDQGGTCQPYSMFTVSL